MSENIDNNQYQNDLQKAKPIACDSFKPWLMAIAIMIFILLALNVYQMINDISAARNRVNLIEITEEFINNNDTDIKLLTIGYRDAVYTDDNVETIYQQLLLSQEFTFEAVNLLADQNNFLISLLAQLP